MTALNAIATIPVGNTLGEGVVWDAAASAVWWTDIEGCALFRLDWPSAKLHRFQTPYRLASFALTDTPPLLLAAFDRGLALFDPESGRTGPLLCPPLLQPGQRLNDGRLDRQGRFWVGAMVEDEAGAAEARLYRVDSRGLSVAAEGLAISNGLAWSPDGRVCYLADSRRQTIWRHDFDPENGELGPRCGFAVNRDGAFPDGAEVDCQGFLWSAQWAGASLKRYAPDGRLDAWFEVPVRQPTCLTFGGTGLDLLFVTSAAAGIDPPQTGAGDLFVYNAPIQGLAAPLFRLADWPGESL